jgi:hypothetical protein
LGERLNGIQEVVGSIPIGSTKPVYTPNEEDGEIAGDPPEWMQSKRLDTDVGWFAAKVFACHKLSRY